MQNELSEMLGEHQMVLDELGGNQGEFAGAAPASLEKGVADMTALQSPVGDPVQTQVAVNGEENTKLNQSPALASSKNGFSEKINLANPLAGFGLRLFDDYFQNRKKIFPNRHRRIARRGFAVLAFLYARLGILNDKRRCSAD